MASVGRIRGSGVKAARWCLSLAVWLGLMLTPSFSQAAAPGVMKQVADLFDLYCLQRYPDLAAMSALSHARGDTVGKADGLPKPGKVWVAHLGERSAVVSAMSDPMGGCSVRMMSRRRVSPQPLIAVLNAYAAAHRLTLRGNEPMLLGDINIAGATALDQNGRRADIFTFATINFRGQGLPGAPDAGESGPGFEIYLGRGASTLPRP